MIKVKVVCPGQNDKVGSLIIELKPVTTPISTTSFVNEGKYATFYSECEYGGNAIRLMPGYYYGDKLGILKNNISSLKLATGLRIKAFIDNDNLSGPSTLITSSSSCISATLRNRIGSLAIEEDNTQSNIPYQQEGNVTLYSESFYKGQSANVMPGNYATMAQAGFTDNSLSSITVPPGYRVVIYEYENFAGKSYTITDSKSILSFYGGNNKASSIKIFKN